MSYITANGSNLTNLFRNVFTSDISFASLVTFTKCIQNSFVVLNSNTTFTMQNLPNIIYISGSSTFNITLPRDLSLNGIIMNVRQISGTTPLSIVYPNGGIRVGNDATSPIAYMSYSLFTVVAGGVLNYYLTYYI